MMNTTWNSHLVIYFDNVSSEGYNFPSLCGATYHTPYTFTTLRPASWMLVFFGGYRVRNR
jgi:hypothetical protein